MPEIEKNDPRYLISMPPPPCSSTSEHGGDTRRGKGKGVVAAVGNSWKPNRRVRIEEFTRGGRTRQRLRARKSCPSVRMK